MMLALAGLGGLLLGCSDKTDSTPDSETTTPAQGCIFDESDGPATATALEGGVAFEGYLCPTADQDWYAFDVSQDLMTVDLSLDAPLTAITPTYVIYEADGKTVAGNAASGEVAGVDDPLSVTHGVGPGSYRMVVRDLGDDDSDTRHPYFVTLTETADPDPNETNDDAGSATPISGTVTGNIAYRGDEDWYEIKSGTAGLVNIQLVMNVGEIQPSFRVVDEAGKTQVTQSNPSGARKATAIDYWHPLDSAGTYYVVVSDDDLLEFDGDVSYELTVDVQPDPDLQEPNDFPSTATDLGAATCGSGWSGEITRTGYLAATGDSDWYKLDLSSCDQGVIEFSAEFSGAVKTGLNTQLRLVRPVPDNSCTTDDDCGELLAYTCDDDIDCYGVGNACGPLGYCEGGGLCLEGNVCAADMLNEVASDEVPGSVVTSAPLWGFDTVYLTVSDAGADTNDVDTSYTLTTRVIDDPDPNERNEQYTGGIPTDDWSNYHDNWSVSVPIYDCDGSKKEECCDSMPWTSGVLSYRYDQDWFQYEHPCPEEDCMVRIHWQFDEGSVDNFLRLYHGSSAWFDIAFQEEAGSHSFESGSYGGLESSDECLYAYNGHGSSPYNISIRDHAIDGDGDDGAWEWDIDQSYSFCVEKLADGCQDPPCDASGKYGCSTP